RGAAEPLSRYQAAEAPHEQRRVAQATSLRDASANSASGRIRLTTNDGPCSKSKSHPGCGASRSRRSSSSSHAGSSSTAGRRRVAYQPPSPWSRSEEHTSELQSRENLVCRLLLEKKKKQKQSTTRRT